MRLLRGYILDLVEDYSTSLVGNNLVQEYYQPLLVEVVVRVVVEVVTAVVAVVVIVTVVDVVVREQQRMLSMVVLLLPRLSS